MKRLQAETAAELDALLPAILDKGFGGGLVPQDPNDEPASVLLERIYKDKARTVTKSRKCA
jgi:type I restriction enzyme S subunit